MRALAVVSGLALVVAGVAACPGPQHPSDPACTARWDLGELEQRDPVTRTLDIAQVDPGPIWTGDLDGDHVRDVILRYRGSRTHASVVLRGCGGPWYQVLLDEVRASQVGTSPGAGGWLDLVLIDGGQRTEYKHGPEGYEAPPRSLGDDFDWQ